MKSRNEYESRSDAAVHFLEEKYNREFQFICYEAGDYLSKNDYVRCTTEGLDSEKEDVIVAVRQEGDTTIYEDNYFSYLIRPEMEDYIADMVHEDFSEIKVYVQNSDEFFSNELTGESSLDDMYRTDNDYRISVKVYIKGDSEMSQTEYQVKMQHIEDLLLASGHSYTIYIFALNPTVYETISRYEQTDFWKFYASNRFPDGEQYYYLYHNMITGGDQ